MQATSAISTIHTRRQTILRMAALALTSSIAGGYVHWNKTQQAAPKALEHAETPQPFTITTANGIRVHHLQTGFVAIKSVHRAYTGPDKLRTLAVALDSHWTDWLPISAWAIEHPEGIIVIDTGESYQAIADPNYFSCDPASKIVYNSLVRVSLRPEDEIGAQLLQLGIKPHDVRWVVQTHLHSDHMGGLSSFEHSNIIVSEQDYYSTRGTLPCRYPRWFKPQFSQFQDEGITGWERSMALTKAGDVRIVSTPGHSPGHQSVVLLDHTYTYFIAGDASFDQAQLIQGGLGAIISDPRLTRQSLSTIYKYTQTHPTIYLPAHDPELRTRLSTNQIVPKA